MEKLINFWNKTNRWHRLGAIFLIAELRLVPSQQYGFTCNDPALSYIFNGDTIDMKWLFSSVLIFPGFVLLLAERIQNNTKSHSWRQQALRWYKEYLFGLLLNMALTAIVKILMGMPRPHFFDTCSPIEAETCEGSEFVARYTCSKRDWMSQSDKSFPSGHAALGAHAGLFLAAYLHSRFAHSQHRPTALVVEAIFLVLSVYCGLSRMWDHRHHWWDVLAGSLLALPILWYTITRLCNNFEPTAPSRSATDKQDAREDGTIKT